MFKKGSYNVKKAENKSKTLSSVKPKTTNTSNTSNTQTSTMTLKKKKAFEMTLKQKTAITNANNKESPEYRKKSYPKTVTTNKRWVENKTFNPK